MLQVAHQLRLHWFPVYILSGKLTQKGVNYHNLLSVQYLLPSPPWLHQAGKHSRLPAAHTTRLQVQVEGKLHQNEHFHTVIC